RKHEVTVFSCGKGDINLGKVRYKNFFALEIKNLPFAPKIDYPIPLKMFFSLLNAHYDVAIIHNRVFLTSFLSVLACRIRRKPCILKEGQSVIDRSTIFKPRKFISFFRAILDNTIFRFTVRNATIVAATTKRTQEYISKSYNVPVRYVGVGVDKKKFRPYPLGKNILYFGRLSRIKKVHILIRSIPYILRRKKVKLIIVGDGDQLDSLKELVRKLNIEEHVDFYGPVPHDFVPEVLKEAMIVAIPFHGGTNLIEAAMMARPIVTVPLRIHKEFLEDAAVYVSPNNPESLARGILFLLNHPKKAEEIGNRAYEIVKEKYDWNKVCERFEAIIDKIRQMSN
ncbi:MAG: glycosyltransferase family 4 protein, partial [Candidatus Baldrarchaeia archaeon]